MNQSAQKSPDSVSAERGGRNRTMQADDSQAQGSTAVEYVTPRAVGQRRVWLALQAYAAAAMELMDAVDNGTHNVPVERQIIRHYDQLMGYLVEAGVTASPPVMMPRTDIAGGRV